MRVTRFLSAILVLMISLNVFTAYADSSVPFQLVESTPANSKVDVELNVEIKLLFNKNVVNFSVKDNNANCIKLYNDAGQAVSADLIFPDDQVDPEKKREIYIKPTELKENTKYTIEISKDMLAKNGNTLGETVFISFTTLSVNSEEAAVQKDDETQGVITTTPEKSVIVENTDAINVESIESNTSPGEEIKDEDAKPPSDKKSSEQENAQVDETETAETAETADTAAEVNSSEVKNASNNNSLMVTGTIAAIAIAAIVIIIKMRRA